MQMGNSHGRTGYLSSLSPIELTALAVSASVAMFLIVDPLVLGAVRSLGPDTYTFFRGLTHLGRSNWILIPSALLLVALYWLRARDSGTRRATVYAYVSQILVFIFAAIAVSGLAASLIKNVIGRARPKMFDLYGPVEFQPMTFDADYASFPSGHSTTAGALAAILAILWPSARIPFFIAGAWIASTRFVIGAHFLSDVIAGFIFGASVVYLLRNRLATRGWLFRINANGKPELRGRILLEKATAKLVSSAASLVHSSR